MPNSIINSLSKKYKISSEELEKHWQDAIDEAKKNNADNEYAYAVSVIEKIAKAKGLTQDNVFYEYKHKRNEEGKFVKKRKSENENDEDNENSVTQDSNRVLDDDFGYLEIKNCTITGEDVAKYWGREIPNYKDLGLQPDKIYEVYRPIEEIKDSNFTNKPLLSQHVDFSADDYKHRFIVGTVGETEATDNQLKGSIVLWSKNAQTSLSKGLKYLSAGYLYDPVLESGQHDGKSYDVKMTNIRANHVALVDNPRYKAAVVADQDISFNVNNLIRSIKKMNFLNKLKKILVTDSETMSFDEGIEATKKIMCDEDLSDSEKEKAIEELKKKMAKSEGEKPDAVEDEDEDEKEKGKKETKAEDEDDDKNDDKKKTTTMDADAIEELVAKRVAQEVAKLSKSRTVFDSALGEYERLCGKPNKMAFDSADSVYDAILKNHGHNTTNKTLAQKQAMVEMLPSLKNKSQSIVYDNALSGKGKSIVPEHFLKNKIFN